MSEWWVGRRGADPVGPVSTETLVRGVKEKKVPPNALVCRVGGQQWQHITEVIELWDLINADVARATVAKPPSRAQMSDSVPPAESLADADADDEATRILNGPMPAMRTTALNAAPSKADATAESATVPLATASTLGMASGADAGTARAPRPLTSKVAPAKAAAPAFRAPAAIGTRTDAQSASAQTSTGGVLKETVKLPKAVIPAPRFGVDRSAPASPIAAGAFINKPPSVRPEPMPKAAVATAPVSVRQGAVPPRVAPKPQVADKARQPIPPVPAAVIPLPADTELAAMLRDNENVSLTETRPDRRMPRDTGSMQRQPQNRQATTVAGNTGSKIGQGATQRATDRPPAPRPAIGRTTAERMPPLEPKPIVSLTDADDDDATVIRGLQPPPVSMPLDEDWTALPDSQISPASIPPDEDATVILGSQIVPESIPPDEDATVVLDSQVVPESIPPDEDGTIVFGARPMPAVGAVHQANAPALAQLEQPAPRAVAVGITEAAADRRAPTQPKPAATTAAQNETPPAGSRRPTTSDVEPRELLDEDEDFLPARAKDYAGAHGPPSTAESVPPRPAAGTPGPPSVIVAQRQVTMDGLERLPLIHTELTHPALRSLRPPGTVQISIATLIVGAMSLIVLVLAAVLLLR